MSSFKFIHAADIHLDSPMRGLSRLMGGYHDHDQPLPNVCRMAFKKLIDLALHEKVNFVILAGDLYDGALKDYNSAIFFNQQIARLNHHQQHQIPVYWVLGNHDAENKMTKNLQLHRPSNLYIFSASSPETFRHPNSQLSVALHGHSYPQAVLNDNIAAHYPPALKDHFNIGVLHTSLEGGYDGHKSYAPCSVDDLTSKDYDYWALGHIHKREVRKQDPHIVFSGCLQGRHIGETGPKGCTLVTVNSGYIQHVSEEHLDSLRWYRCEVDVTGIYDPQDITQRIFAAIEGLCKEAMGRDLALRIELCGESELASDIIAQRGFYLANINSRLPELEETFELRVYIESIKTSGLKSPPLSPPHLHSSQDHNSGQLSGTIHQLLNSLSDPSHRLIGMNSDGTEKLPGLQSKVSTIWGKIPAHLRSSLGERDYSLGDEKILGDLVEQGKQLLEGRLKKHLNLTGTSTGEIFDDDEEANSARTDERSS